MVIIGKNFLGLDIGGTKIFAARFTAEGKIEQQIELKTEADRGSKKVLENIMTAIRAVQRPEVRAIGIGWPGFIQSVPGKVIHTPNIPGFRNFALTVELRKRTGMPVFLENDARLFAWAEAQRAVHRKHSSVLGIVLGTGVGGGLILNGQIYAGEQGYGGEIGHTPIDLETGTEVEALFSGNGLEQFLRQREAEHDLETLARMLSRTTKLPPALEAWLELFAQWLSGLLAMFNPGLIVLGGGVSRHVLRPLLPRIRQEVKKLMRARQLPGAVK